MNWGVSSLAFLVLLVTPDPSRADFRDLPGPYCATRRGQTCCPNRDDQCTVPIMGTVCYCDMFCDRTSGADCCPDFLPVCRGIPIPQPIFSCPHKGKAIQINQEVKDNCNTCTCKETSPGVAKMVCDDKPCLIRPEIISGINGGDYGWKASNYSFLWGLTLDEGIERKTGTFKPEQPVMNMHSVDMNGARAFEENFDARQRWPGYIQPIRDQGNCACSWAVSTVDVAADRHAILTNGEEIMALSAQQLISCNNKRQQGCKGGYTDRAWQYMVDTGVVSEKCYPFTSGRDGIKGRCESTAVRCPGEGPNEVYKSPPPYRISNNENEIKAEIKKNGPVQAIFLVREDFYSYKSGVYSHARLFTHLPYSHRRSSLHSVRIIGWGVDRTFGRPIKYWLCANSWGTEWGEDGYFRILRGVDESDIEMFVVGAWTRRLHPEEHDKSINIVKRK
uniref:Peptidase C1A domain containing protein n=1 Tax=Scolopendra viridis TaxID=118503 RepID=A0A4D5R905_SCOVI